MIFSYEQSMIETRKALLRKLLSDNQKFKFKFSKLCDSREYIIDYLDDELHKLSCTDRKESSAEAEAILEHLKVLTNRFFNDINRWTQSLQIDFKWLSDSLYKCDPLHTDIWWKMMNQSNDYHNLLTIMHSRFEKVIDMFVYIVELL